MKRRATSTAHYSTPPKPPPVSTFAPPNEKPLHFPPGEKLLINPIQTPTTSSHRQ
ncbi:hypothetical protein L211DRAFT_832767 [Terfezia boudieri ATCC MYA-4762]|uniref:Uncharacterized protein n=1 Tax=Terfezia boudieri ATCC MYA-4762 TaxID=1051890 RepID=A0A3N4M144_9PEZI|nr:hypothetical protein L211DRAFT_832767 [Terfezia boudieri ATCC MYA-4762]